MTNNYPKPSNKQLLDIYRKAVLVKLHDERVIKEMTAGKLVTPYYSARGQEIIPAAMSQHLNDDDYLCTIYRGVHDMLCKGFPLDLLWAELAGRVTGTCKGKGGPMHLTYPDKGIMVTTGVVGGSMPIAVGLGWASQLNGKKQVSVANFGDGAANIGAFHEAMNMAALWKLPVIFICQNNQYAEHTSFERSTAVDKLSKRAAGYAMEGITVDGNNPDEMFGAAQLAVERARNGEGPTFIEAITFRFNGHLIGDGGNYMDKQAYATAQKADPLPILRKRLIDEAIASEADLSDMENSMVSEIAAAVETAYAADFPSVEELKCDVFADNIA